MKKTFKITASLCTLAASIMLPSCELNETIYSSIYTEDFYKTASDAEKGLVAVYGALGSLGGAPALTLIADFSDDQTYPRGVVGRNTLTLFTYDVNYTTQKSNSRVFESPQQIWQACYGGIEKANWVIAKVPNATMDETRKKQILGEAYFLRAFYHWFLTKNFGDIPIKITPSYTEEEALTAKSPKADVYKQIYADLDLATSAGLPSFPSVVKGRASNEAALALYAKAALYNEDWAKALEKAKATIATNKHALLPNVVDVYRYDNEDAARLENIFAYEVDPVSPGLGHQLVGLCGPAGSAAPAYARTSFGSMFAYQSFFNSFDPADKRRTLLDTNYIDKAGKIVPQKSITPITTQGVLIKKYQDPVSTIGLIPNIPILRMPDVYLIAAEAEARLNGPTAAAYEYVNMVRNRAGLPNLKAGLAKDAFIEAVLQERAWEFFAEGDRWYDLTRTGKFLTVIPKAVNSVYPVRNVTPKNKYFPIPQDEINANSKLEQNPDWK
ncbi:RagB/SusD family nutrient uptake outer membrane protein [Dyadobacter pollutisoli]|uniref:RagB/SusD family nutrient uptake outer membrane protein n=1 Tax=Dyadobacter pollutisoli TaxID=2910158 RepID=A0A9E8N682_9BACT|nr:RagB/SusD family nutrient uptake outer membrane protein [Dyadobacter pollutisoli]WAC09508.1 RagB/SusD family nutrient uptake outer membrane protein [Dyadobacter pollutisoli]